MLFSRKLNPVPRLSLAAYPGNLVINFYVVQCCDSAHLNQGVKSTPSHSLPTTSKHLGKHLMINLANYCAV